MAIVPETANLTKLAAVNEILFSIGEKPVSSLASGLPDAALAEAVLDRVSRQVQLEGWNSNTRRGIVLSRDDNNYIAVPVDTLRAKLTNSKSHRKTTRGPHSGHISATVRRQSDDTRYILYDLDNDTELWANNASLTVDIVQMLELQNLPPALQAYITAMASRKFQSGTMGSRIAFEITQGDVIEALTMALNDDEDQSSDHIKRESPHVYNVSFRNNPIAG